MLENADQLETSATSNSWPFDNSYAALPDSFYAKMPPKPVKAPQIIRVNRGVADLLGLNFDDLCSAESAQIFAGNVVPDGSAPLAQAYAGHQFGHYSPQLGDGRAILLGEIVGPDGVRRDVQLKGSGRTPFSRGGDGRAAVGPVLREYIVSEGMQALGVPTTRALAAVTTGEPIMREELLPGAILTRVAQSHLRVGTFQFFYFQKDWDAVKTLADYAIHRHDKEAASADNPYAAFLQNVIERQAKLIAAWLNVGFIHGVMNTDNMSIAGETIDYGPCAFLDTYHPSTVFSSIDHAGRYAYGNQPSIAHWNLSRLAQALLPILDPDEEKAVEIAQGLINTFPARFEAHYLAGLRQKLGLRDGAASDMELAQSLLELMADGEADFTLTFRRLCEIDDAEAPAAEKAAQQFNDPKKFQEWLKSWLERLRLNKKTDTSFEVRRTQMQSVNPIYIPRNHLVEEALDAANRGNHEPFENILAVLADPYTENPAFERFAQPPRPSEIVHQTFCGT